MNLLHIGKGRETLADEMKKDLWRVDGALTAGLFLFALSLRLKGLGIPSSVCFSSDPNPPLYYLLLHYWMSLAGSTESLLRLPSALLGAATAALLFPIGKKYFSRRVGLISALLAGTAAFHLSYSQEARSYTLVTFLPGDDGSTQGIARSWSPSPSFPCNC